jgi:two-component system response regulator DctR
MDFSGDNDVRVLRHGEHPVAKVYTVNPDPVSGSVTARILASVQIPCHNFLSPFDLLNELPLPSSACFIFDFALPEMNGLQLMDRLRRMDCLHPVIFAAARTDPDLIVTAMNRGAFGFLKRPFNSMEIVDMVQRALILDRALLPYVRSALDYRKRRHSLSKREQTILGLLELGKSAREVGGELNLSVRTVENHRARIFQKLNIRQAAQLIERVTCLNLLRANGTLD